MRRSSDEASLATAEKGRLQPSHRLFRSTTTDSSHYCALSRTVPLLPKDRCKQPLAFGLFFSVGTLGNRCHLTRLFAVSTTHDLV